MGAYSFQRPHLRRDMLDGILVHSPHRRAGASRHGWDVYEHSAVARKDALTSVGFCNSACRRIRIGHRDPGSIDTTIGLLKSGRPEPRKRRHVALNCCKIAITLIDPETGETNNARLRNRPISTPTENILSCITSNDRKSSSETREFSDEFVTQELYQVHRQDARIVVSLRKRSQTCKYISAWQ